MRQFFYSPLTFMRNLVLQLISFYSLLIGRRSIQSIFVQYFNEQMTLKEQKSVVKGLVDTGTDLQHIAKYLQITQAEVKAFLEG